MPLRSDLLCYLGLSAIVGWFAWLSLLSAFHQPHYNPASFCPDNRPVAQVTWLIDPSSTFTPAQKASLTQLTDWLLKDGLPKNARLSVFKLQEKVALAPLPEFERCYPGPPGQSSGSRARSMAETFQADLRTAVSGLLQATAEKSSPIIEGLHILTSADGFEPKGQLIISGDLLQNSSLTRHYGHPARIEDYATFARKNRAWLACHPLRLKGAEIVIFQLQNAPLNNLALLERHRAFWTELFKKAGASGVRWCALDKTLIPRCLTGWQGKEPRP